MTRNSTLLIVILCFGFAFLYIPILSMIVYSFNGSRLVTVWGGWMHRMPVMSVDQRHRL